MSYASRSGRAKTSVSNPRAFAVCDRCGAWVNHDKLQWQTQWAGAALQNIRLLVCSECLDRPQEGLRAIVLPPDPVPIINARVEPFLADESGNVPPIGQPVGLEQAAIMPLGLNSVGAVIHLGVPISALSVVSSGTNVVTVTCSAAHGLSDNGQISVAGLTNPRACGFFSVVVTNPMIFTYETFSVIAAASLLTGTSRIVTALVGLPRGVTTIPQVGP